MNYLGDFSAGSTVRVMWTTNAAAGQSITRATNGSIRVYKDNSTTQRSSSSGITDSEDFDSLTGVHHVNIDLSDNADAGFYAAGHDYFVVLEGATIDGKTINAVLGHFSIENRHGSASPDELHLVKAVVCNKKVKNLETGVTAVKDDDGTTTLLTLTPSVAGSAFTVTPT